MAKIKPKPVERQHEPRAGRRAFICEHEIRKDVPCNARRFMRPGEPTPECEAHGKMKPQPNRPYRGQAVPS